MSQQKKKPVISCLWCFHSSDWKREEILDHSFSLINVNDYVNKSMTMRIKYLWIFFYVFKTILVYLFDLYLLYQSYETDKYQVAKDQCEDALRKTMTSYINYSWKVNKVCEITDSKIVKDLVGNGKDKKGYIFWLLLFSISITYLLSILEWQKAKKIIKSQDISFAYTNLVAYRYYCIKSYAYYCFFQLIQDHTKRSDDIAFFVFFTFKGWKSFMFADSPRRILNLILFLVNLAVLTSTGKGFFESMLIKKESAIQLFTSSFILLSWIFTGIRLLIALIVYIPLLSIIQGNLKEYCCHKIDKRIGEIINSKTKQKIKAIQKVEKAKIEAARKLGVNPNQLHLDGSVLKKDYDIEILPDPTLPNIDVDLNDVGTVLSQDNYYNTPYNTPYNGTQQWNTPPPSKLPPRSQQGWNDQMSNMSNGTNSTFRKNGLKPPFDSVSINSEEPLIPQRKIYRK
ncbi:hypothetical protein H8356DRAFT_980777 [Neocallimastix lanati (nom. inval.)]|uniref:Uncharacterized protein n=1 Tax=Neocallimastix californiae TaxID=1754190 RepID=A0A1Y2FX22_9FUNG|nr:hypothetical protein H8356DRAFT_980777 [Neocallimastix sp. JGI-2020a]ORY87225.1 hypothetical protein LY90DRAFT_662947 [Neocallimastix californiae]|eukprot:ORY87225.1 hypothetical protein LY90DRAFT_662947 [Neocallimastix californiae]